MISTAKDDTPPAWWSRTPHLAALGIAVVFAGLILAAGILLARSLEQRHVYETSSQIFSEKNNGVALQKLAFKQPNLLPLYGSSELIKRVEGKPGEFFQAHPGGYQVFEVGRSGAACLSIVEKLAAIGPELRGKKVVISISPIFFFERHISERFFAGNFSQLQAEEIVFGRNVSYPLRRDIARQILTHPTTFANDPLLAFGLKRLTGDSFCDHLLFYASIPLGRLDLAILKLQDHFHAAVHIHTERHHLEPFAPRPAQPIPWDSLIAQAAAGTKPADDHDPDFSGPEYGPKYFAQLLDNPTAEWTDFELLLRVMHELGARPLVLSMPLSGTYFDQCGVARADRDVFYNRVRALADKYNTPLIDFKNHDYDDSFADGHHDHLSLKGWLYFDRAVDDFYHDRPLSEAAL